VPPALRPLPPYAARHDAAAAGAAAAHRVPLPAAVLLRLAGGAGGAALAGGRCSAGPLAPPAPRRAFSSTSARHASSPAPNVAPALPEDAAPVDALAPLVDPAVYGWWPSSFAELGIVAVHEATGLPWWQCIAGITLGVRTLLFPLVIYQVLRRLRWRLRWRLRRAGGGDAGAHANRVPCADEECSASGAGEARDGAHHQALEGAGRVRGPACSFDKVPGRPQAAL